MKILEKEIEEYMKNHSNENRSKKEVFLLVGQLNLVDTLLKFFIAQQRG
jgi:hypothetical protein